MKKRLAWLVILIYLAIGTFAWAQPKIPPKPTTSIYVQDYAGLLAEDTSQKINTLGNQLAVKTKAQVAVVTVKSLEGAAIEEYALAVLREWGIGNKELNNGVLLLVAVDERRSRIEVGYGLEGALPDGKTGRIQDEYLIPYFRNGDYDKGILNTYLTLALEVAKEYNVKLSNDVEPTPGSDEISTESLIMIVGSLLLLFGIDWIFLDRRITKFILLVLSSGKGPGGGGYGGGGFGGGSGGGSSGFGGGSGGGGGSTRPW